MITWSAASGTSRCYRERLQVFEDEAVRQVARALLLTHSQFIEIRRRYKEQLDVIQALRKTQQG